MMVVTGDKGGDEPTRTVRAVLSHGTEMPVDIGLTPVGVDGTKVVITQRWWTARSTSAC
mgnify:CR=1 FL=1